MAIHFYENDLPQNHTLTGERIAVDCEAMGLNTRRDRPCLVQLSSGDGEAHLVKIDVEHFPTNLMAVLTNPDQVKIMHYGRFDMALIYYAFDQMIGPVFCTKIASKLVRTYAMGHGLKDLCAEFLNIELDKGPRSSDWGAPVLSDAQKNYAASDVLYLHQIHDNLVEMLERENRMHLCMAVLQALPVRAGLDVIGFTGDIFSHS